MKLLVVCVLLVGANAVQDYLPAFRFFKDVQLALYGRSMDEPKLLQRAKDKGKIQSTMPPSYPFPCFNDEYTIEDARSEHRPTSVHELRPGDIDVIGAMGDSLTAANGAAASTIFQVLVENRGVSWSIGGKGDWRQYFTIPNMLKEFNPKLVGYSYGDNLPHHRGSQFNVAELGSVSEDFPYMVTQLVKRMKHDPRVNMDEDWKLVTMMIGANDFCVNACLDKSSSDILEQHRRDLYTTLKYLKKNVPRILVNLVPPPDVTLLRSLNNNPFICNIAQKFECPCIIGEPSRPTLHKVKKIIKQWQMIDIEVANLPEFHNSDDFTIVVQPFILNIELAKNPDGYSDYDFFSHDCFHFSQKGYAQGANALWNNMFEPVGNKTLGWSKLYEKVNCPSKSHPYIFTNKNSGKTS